MKQDQWIDDLRKRMDDYSESVPTELWEELEEELNHQEHARVIPLWRRWQTVAAAVILAVATSSLWYVLRPSSDSSQRIAVAPQIEQSEKLETAPSTSTFEKSFPTDEEVRQATQSSHGTVRIKPSVVAQQLPTIKKNDVVEVENVATDEKVEEESNIGMSDEQVEATPSEKKQSVVEQKPQRKATHTTPTQSTVIRPTKEKKGWSVDVYTGGGQINSGNTNNYMYVRSPMMYTKDNHQPQSAPVDDLSAGGSYLNGYSGIFDASDGSRSSSNIEYKHKTPVTVGLSVRIYLDRHWALETGLMYTQLSSEMWNNGNSSRFKQEQTLHYVGVPLKLNRILWENKWIDLYASAGGAVEKNVSAKIKTAYSSSDNAVNKNSVDLDIDRLQWSVSGGVGAQFHLTDKLGAYVEPGINYYFDDGVDIQTIRKEHPLNFNLKLGVRLNLGR